jgi:hypothetical protein
MKDERGPKERAYDEKINPLMAQIIAIAREHKINMFATFSLDADEDGNPIACTTSLPIDEGDEVGIGRVDACYDFVYLGRRRSSALKITTERADGSKTVEHVVTVD